MKKLFATGITAAALVGTLAFAPATPAKAEPAAMFNWTGFYIGADAGALFGDGTVTNPAVHVSANTDSSSLMYGGHLGYRYQFASNWVAGIEGQLWRSHQYDSVAHYVGAANNAILDAKHGYTALGTLGFTIDPQVLIYGVGGFSSVHYFGCTTFAGTSTCALNADFSSDRSAFTWGGGIAILITPNLIMRFQYLHADYGSKTFVTTGLAGGATSADMKTDTVTAGLSWKFGN